MKIFTVLFCMMWSISLCSAEFKVQSTTVNDNFINPVGYDLQNLSFSWKLPLLRNGMAQSAYRVVVASSAEKLPERADYWDSGRVESDCSVKIRYAGRVFKSRDRAFWMVKIWDENGQESAWSDLNTFEIGLTDSTEWQGKWLSSTLPGGLKQYVFNRSSLPEGRGTKYEYMKPAYIRKEFAVSREISHARLYATAKGIYEASINGNELSKARWIPGWTEYSKRIQCDTYDISKHMLTGANCIGILLGDGWYSGNLHKKRKRTQKPWFLGQIEIFYTDGTSETIATSDSWLVSSGPRTFGDIFDGEDYDANLEMPGWDNAGFNASGWTEPEVADIDNSVALDPRRNRPVTEMREVTPVSVAKLSDGVFVFNMGQNMVGWPRLINVPVAKGSLIKLRFAEILKSDGTLYVDNYRAAISEDTYIPSVDGRITWEPRLTYHGFQYVEISGVPKGEELGFENIKGIVLFNDMALTGDFECSNPKLNKLQSNIQWGQYGNFFSVPTDCPQRDERLGWTGDAQVFAPTASFNMDVEAFFSKWLRDLNDCQDENGAYPNVAPYGVKNKGSAGWSDVGIIAPYEMYLAYGNIRILEEYYENMKRWIRFLKEHSSKNLIRTGFAFGDWLQPNSEAAKRSGKDRGSDCPSHLIGTAYFYRTTLMMEKIAQRLKKPDDAAEFAILAEEIKEAFNKTFVREDGRMDDGKKHYVESQTAYLVPLAFGLLDAETEKKAAEHLLRKIKDDDNHLNTGFIGTPILTSVLTKIGAVDLAYELLEKETYPSWLFPVNQGATTMWERWDAYSHEKGIHPARGNSFNHYAYGAIGKWMYAKVAGIDYDENQPGYKNIVFAPVIGGTLTHASAWHETPYGKASSSWIRKNNAVQWKVVIPANATGTIIVPTLKTQSVFVNQVHKPVKKLEKVPSGIHAINFEL